jgi:DNA-binding transcriptional regulator YiaG
MSPESIRRFRAQLGLSKQRLADMLGVSLRAVEAWESEASSARHAPPYLGLALAALNARLEPWK